MSNKLLFGLPNPTLDSEAVSLGCLKTHVYGTLFNTLLWEYFINHSKCTYRIDCAIIQLEVTIDQSTRKISTLYDQTLNGNNAIQGTTAQQPVLCTLIQKVNLRYHMIFDNTQRLVSDIDLNPAAGKPDRVNNFVV